MQGLQKGLTGVLPDRVYILMKSSKRTLFFRIVLLWQCRFWYSL